MPHGCVNQPEAAAGVVPQVAQRLLHAFAHQGECREMEHSLPFAPGEHAVDHRGVVHVRNHQFDTSGDGGSMALA